MYLFSTHIHNITLLLPHLSLGYLATKLRFSVCTQVGTKHTHMQTHTAYIGAVLLKEFEMAKNPKEEVELQKCNFLQHSSFNVI